MRQTRNSVSSKELRSIDNHIKLITTILSEVKELLVDTKSDSINYYNEVLRSANTNTTELDEEEG
jgi:hypothetical protein